MTTAAVTSDIFPVFVSTSEERSARRVAFVTLGCKTNLLESSALADGFQALGWQVVRPEQAADLYVVNTCTVTEKADAEARRLMRRIKRQHPTARIAATGCYAQVSPEVLAELDCVDLVIGNGWKEQIPHLLTHDYANHYRDLTGTALVLVDEFDKSRQLETPVASFAGIERTRGSIKIQDGCDYKCTYCIIWKGRGPSRSMAPDVLVQQVQAMVDEGFQEITLTGINIGQYQWDGLTLAGLLRHLVTVEGHYRLRLTSLDPLEVTDELMDVLAECPDKIAPHVHLSTQSAHDGVLKAMARRHHEADLWRICETLVDRVPYLAVGSDVIVGFPTETDEAFNHTLQVIEQLPMHYVHVFRYSPRPGTPAAALKPQVPERIRKQRAQQLIALATTKREAFARQFVGQVRPVLLEAQSSNPDVWEGYTDNYLRVSVERHVAETAGITPGRIVALRLTAYDAHQDAGGVLHGVPVAEAPLLA